MSFSRRCLLRGAGLFLWPMVGGLRRLMLILGLLGLSACQTLQPPAVDTVRFSPAPITKRTIAEPKVKYLVRPDGYLADTGKGVNGELIGAVATSLGL